MYARKTLTTTVAATAVLMLVAPAAQAAHSYRFDRSAFDSSPVTPAPASRWRTDRRRARRPPQPLAPGQRRHRFLPRASARPPTSRRSSPSHPVSRSPSRRRGELCSHFIDGTPTLDAYFGKKQVSYTGAHKRARVTDGMHRLQQQLARRPGVGRAVRSLVMLSAHARPAGRSRRRPAGADIRATQPWRRTNAPPGPAHGPHGPLPPGASVRHGMVRPERRRPAVCWRRGTAECRMARGACPLRGGSRSERLS